MILSELTNSTEVVVKLALFFSCNQIDIRQKKITFQILFRISHENLKQKQNSIINYEIQFLFQNHDSHFIAIGKFKSVCSKKMGWHDPLYCKKRNG